MLGAIDYHWHRYGYPCGIMNEFYELKPGETVDGVFSYNGRSVLLLDKGNKYCYWNNEKLELKVSFSCFEPKGVKNSKLEIKLSDSKHKTIEYESVDIEAVKCGNIKELGEFKFSLPASITAEQYYIQVSFAGFMNKWPVWSFPDIDLRANNVIENKTS